jgi:predicted ribonuclease toxin of YeeF-YezG toxin-antitoxin module
VRSIVFQIQHVIENVYGRRDQAERYESQPKKQKSWSGFKEFERRKKRHEQQQVLDPLVNAKLLEPVIQKSCLKRSCAEP